MHEQRGHRTAELAAHSLAPFITASEDDIPRILNPYFPDWNNGVPGEFKNFTRDINLTEEVIVTPAQHTTVIWYLDNQEVATGNKIDMPLLAGTYVLKVVARTTKGLETSRTGLVIVRPCEGDPVPGDLLFDRLVVPGTVATLWRACWRAWIISRARCPTLILATLLRSRPMTIVPAR